MRYFLLTLVALVTFKTNAQELTIDYNRLNEKVIGLINEHRNQLQLSELKKDAILFKAAKDHSLYMLENKILSHEQKNKTKQFPKDRILFYEGNMFQSFGENVLFTTIEPKKYNTSETDALAKKIFLQWKHSPPHYKNIISNDYDYLDLAFSYDRKLKRLYATNVFGTKGVVIPNQLSDNAFGIDKKSSLCKTVSFSDKIHLGNGLQIEGNEVVLYYYDLEKFKTILNEPSDAIAIDFIDLEQFQCGERNQFDISPIYDGVLSKPIYRKELLENNRAENKLKLITKVGEVPQHLIGKKLALSIVFVLNNCACEYASPIEVESNSIRLLPVEPILEIPKNVILSNKGIIKTDQHEFAFDRNEVIEKLENSKSYFYQETEYNQDEEGLYQIDEVINTEIEIDSVPEYDTALNETFLKNEQIQREEVTFEIINTEIHSTQIYSFSSIEGNETDNIKLYQARAIAIEKYGKEKLDISIKPNKVIAAENWETCFIQLEMENRSDLVKLSKNEIRKYINTHKKNWEDYLNQQRISKLIANYYGEIKTTNPNDPYYLQFLYQVNLRTGIYEKNINKINFALAKIATLEDYDVTIFEEPVFQEIMNNPNVVQNAAAVLVTSHHFNYFYTIKFLKHWLNVYDTLSEKAQFNLLLLYCVINDQLLDSWDIATSKLANVVKPKTLETQFDYFKTNLNLIANYHYVSLYYCNHVNDYDGINFYFNKVYQSFKNSIKTSQDRINLALFLNHWSSYSTSVSLLKEEMKKPSFSKEEALLLAQTYPIFVQDNGQNDTDLDYILKKVYRLNKNEWCKWQNNNSNLLRNNTIKKEYCKMCQ